MRLGSRGVRVTSAEGAAALTMTWPLCALKEAATLTTLMFQEGHKSNALPGRLIDRSTDFSCTEVHGVHL